MNSFTSVANVCKAPEALELGGRQCMKLRLADNTWGKNNEPLFFDAIVSGPDADVAKRLMPGDQICISGTLCKGFYQSKKGKNAGSKVETFSIPFAKIIAVTKSPSFFAGAAGADESDNSAPDLGAAPGSGLSNESDLEF